MSTILGSMIILGGVVATSYAVEALRRAPRTPGTLPWAPDARMEWVKVGGVRLRTVVAGTGPPLVLLHTLRTQLDIFQRVFSALAGRYTLYAVDLPGHGHSDIPPVDYTADFFIDKIAELLDRLELRDAVVAGESIGGTIALALAARRHPRVRAAIGINTYDYDRGRGAERASLLSRVLFTLARVPVVGATVMRLRQYPVIKAALDGGVHRMRGLPAPLAREMYEVGNRRGHYQAFMSLITHWPTWEAVADRYGDIDRPVLLLYGDHDWSRPAEREHTARRIPGAEVRTVANAGHFLSLDAPEEVVAQVSDFIDRLPAPRVVQDPSG
jgi:pimeloyl-ACP methyl ester carboxylesterase